MTIHVGLDLSLISPGIAILNTTTGFWSLFAFTQRVREHKFNYQGTTASITLLPAIPNFPLTTNEERYEHIRRHIVDIILDPYIKETTADVVIGIECYAFGAKNSGSSYKLQELGGVLKHSLWQKAPHWRREIIPPTQWKKKTMDNGRATKADVVAYVETHGPYIPLLDVLGLVPTKNGDIPCPVQDLADAVCICLSTTLPTTPLVKKKRKRKSQSSK
jgi:Holliday junction resolvasome RuvABC endonuclease subunit